MMPLIAFVLAVVAAAFSAYDLYATPAPKGLGRIALFLLAVAVLLSLVGGEPWKIR